MGLAETKCLKPQHLCKLQWCDVGVWASCPAARLQSIKNNKHTAAPVHVCLLGGSAAKQVFEGALELEPQTSFFFPPQHEMFTYTQNYVSDFICLPFRIIQDNKNWILDFQLWNVLLNKRRTTNTLSCIEKLYTDPRRQILSRCTLIRISIYRKEKTRLVRTFWPLVTGGRGDWEAHMPIQDMLHLCPGDRNLS